jgi:aldehyde dehydrogenase (NAD+)
MNRGSNAGRCAAGLAQDVPFGGRKNSSDGPGEQGSYAREFYTVVKTAYVAP